MIRMRLGSSFTDPQPTHGTSSRLGRFDSDSVRFMSPPYAPIPILDKRNQEV